MSNLRPLILMVPFDVRQINIQCMQEDGSVERYTYMFDDIKKCLLEPKEIKDAEK
jgi:hypothetical protein